MNKRYILFNLFACFIQVTIVNAQTEKKISGSSPHIKDYGLKPYVYLSKDLPHTENKPWKLVCQMPYNCQFQPWIEVESIEGKMISLNSSNTLVLYLTKTETVVTKKGKQSYEAKNWISGEGAVYNIPAGVKVNAVKYRETGYNTKLAGSFECNDNDYNILWKKGQRTAYLCMRDWFFDCPDRERVGFWGDGTPELNQCFYAFDKNSHKLCKELVLRPLDSTFYPGQQLEFLGEYGLWYYYLQTGDEASLKKVYPATKNFLFNTYRFGKKNQWFDWGKDNKDIAVTEQCFMYIDLKTLKKIAMLSGNEKDTPAINIKLESIRSDFNSKFWKGKFYISDQVTEPDDRANAMAINAGLADETKWDAIFSNVLTQKTYSSSFFDRWVFEALCKIGKEEYALLRMYNRYKTMIPASFTTLWEHYDRWWASWIDAFDDVSSLNHGWNPPVINLSQTIAGISPVEPGWKIFEVLPKEAFLTNIKVTVPSIKGPVHVIINKSGTNYSISLNSPAGTKAIIGIPKKSFATLNSIKVNGQLIWKSVNLSTIKGISFYKETDDYLMFYASPGSWNFIATGELRIHSPKSLPPLPDIDIKLNKKLWTATASVKDSLYLFSDDKIPIEVPAENAIDGDHWTGWRNMTKKQYRGQWFSIDLKQSTSFYKIVLDNTWALWDSPKSYSVITSNNNTTWSNPIAEGQGSLGITTIKFPDQKARYIKIIQTGNDSLYNWSIYEIDIFQKINK